MAAVARDVLLAAALVVDTGFLLDHEGGGGRAQRRAARGAAAVPGALAAVEPELAGVPAMVRLNGAEEAWRRAERLAKIDGEA